MKDDNGLKGGYAGDAAWREWFEMCAVARCGENSAERLRAQVASSMYAQLSRYGLTRVDACGDDPVAAFDSYFRLKGSRDAKKPLKLYFAHRIEAEGLRMADFVCGTLFGALSGRIHDIVLDWIATLKGWKPRFLRGEGGRRRLVWEGAGAEDVAELERADVAGGSEEGLQSRSGRSRHLICLHLSLPVSARQVSHASLMGTIVKGQSRAILPVRFLRRRLSSVH